MKMRDHRVVWRGALVGGVVVLLAPIWILWCPGAARWRTHLYQTVLYGQIAQRLTRDAHSTAQIVERLADYVNTHVWPATDVGPYDGKPLDYLVKGIGWCDYLAKIHMRLLATCQIPARYAMLLQTKELSPHTVAEVWYGGRWGVYDVLFNIRFTDLDGKPLTLQMLSESPHLLEAQPVMAILRQQLPDTATQIHELYAKVLPVTIPPRRSKPSTEPLTLFDRLALLYARWGGQRFVDWYQDRYLASVGLSRPSTSVEVLQRARHWHLAGRPALAKRAYLRCVRDDRGSPVGSEARFWLGLLQWELEDDAAGALRTFKASVVHDPHSRWLPMTWYYMGRCEEALDHADEAHAWYIRARAAGIVAACLRVDRLTNGVAQSVHGSTAGPFASTAAVRP